MSELNSDSESCPSYLTESESEHESIWGEDREQKEVDYTATAKDIICENVNITTENALNLNSGYHNMLKVLKNKLEILLAQCQERQGEVEKQIVEYRNAKKPLVGKSRTSGYICGQPYFKDEDLYPGPHNEDYLYRKNVRMEFFPLDMFEVTDTNWTVKDKVNILKGVKMQIIEFIGVENRLKIKKIGNGLEAERLRREILSLKGKEIGDLWEKVKLFPKEYPDQKFEIDWLRISNVNINGRHSVAACIGIWNNYMIPGLIRSSWNHNEEQLLLEAAEKHNRQNWMEIAREVPGRSPYQCFVHYQTTFSDLAQIKHERWTEEEDELLVKLVDDNRIGSNIVWNKVVEKMPLRNKIQCYNRYMFTLMRPMKHTKFTPEEDCIITAYVQECGDEFRFIPPNLLPGRTNRQIWARYNHTLKYVNKHSGWTIEEDYRLINFIRENLTEEGPRKISWAACSKALGNHSRLSCRTRYYTIEKFLEKNPDATLDDVPRKEKKLSTKVTNENWMKTMFNMRKESTSKEREDQEMPSTSSEPQKQPKVRKKRDPLFKNRNFSDTIKCVFRKRFFEKLKYSFHYKFGDQFPTIEKPKVFCSNKAIFYLLHCTTSFERVNDYSEAFTMHELKFIRTSLSMRLNPGLVNYLQSARYCFLFPPSYNTILGLRGVVLNASYPEEAEEISGEVLDADETAYQYALENFRSRFRMVFFWTMLLVKQNPRDTDFHKNENSLPMDTGLAEQISLQQLSKLHNSARLPRCDSKNPHAENNTKQINCVDQSVHSNTKPHRKSRAPRRLPKAQAVPTKEIMITSTVEHPPHPTGNIPVNETPATFETMATSNINVLTSQLAPYQLQYSIIPDQIEYYGANSSTTIQPTPIYHTVPYIPAAGEQVGKPPDQMSLVAQITIINPIDLPAAQILEEPVPVGTAKAATIEPAILPCEVTASNAINTDQTFEVYNAAHSVGRDHSKTGENGSILEQMPAVDLLKNDARDMESTSKGPNQLISTVPHTESVCAYGSIRDVATELDTDIGSDNDSDATTSVGDFVIEEIEEILSCVSSKVGSPKPASENVEAEEPSGFETAEPDENAVCSGTTFAGSNTDLKLENSHDLCMPSVSSTLDCSEVPKASVNEPMKGPSSTADDTLLTQTVDKNDWEWNMKTLHATRKTYNRSCKQRITPREVTSLSSHAWRWIHLEKAKPEEIGRHQDVWEQCNPERMKFNPKPNNNDSTESMKVPNCDEIIVIDDDEIQIKEEPVEVEENEVACIADGEPLDKMNVDEPSIQEIIQTASNIWRMSKTYNGRKQTDIDSAAKVSSPLSPPLPPPVLKSLPLQSSSRIFDEQTNCYYFVDEVTEEATNDVEAPVIDIPQMCRKYPADASLDDIIKASLAITCPVNAPMDNSQRNVESVSNFQQSAFENQSKVGSNCCSNEGPSHVLGNPETAVRELKSQPEIPKIGKPKRPPREQRVERSHGAQKKALSLLDALYKQPRLGPSICTPSSSTIVTPQPLPNLCSDSSTTGQRLGSQKRQPSPEHSLHERESKRSKRSDGSVVAFNDGAEEEYSGILEQIDESYDAVDIISVLSSMRQSSASRISEDDDSDDEVHHAVSPDQHHVAVDTVVPRLLSDQPKHQIITKESVPCVVPSTTTQQKVQTIVQNTTGRSAMNVQFKVAGLTIKKVRNNP